jgi:hypothetical protein
MDEQALFTKNQKSLDDQARKLEDWMLNNTNHPDFLKVIRKYNDLLFKKATRQELHDNFEKGMQMPQTVSLPRFINKNENFKR